MPDLLTAEASLIDFPASPVLDCLSDGIIATDTGDEPVIVYANQAACDITGYDADELVGHSPKVLQGPATDRGVMRQLREDLAAGLPFSGQTTNYRKDGTPFVMEWSISTLADPDGEPAFFVAVQRDATFPARRLLEAQTEARTDPLTGLPNRSHIDQVLDGGGWLSTSTTSRRSTTVTGIWWGMKCFDSSRPACRRPCATAISSHDGAARSSASSCSVMAMTRSSLPGASWRRDRRGAVRHLGRRPRGDRVGRQRHDRRRPPERPGAPGCRGRCDVRGQAVWPQPCGTRLTPRLRAREYRPRRTS